MTVPFGGVLVVWLSGKEAAVDGDVGAGDVGGVGGEQERDDGRDLVAGGGAPQRDCGGRDRCRSVGVGGSHLGVDHAGLEFDDADALLAVVLRRAAGQAAAAVP